MKLNSGIIEVTGEHDTGKTTFMLEAVDPSKTVFVDDDVKGEATVNQMRESGIDFLRYYNLVNMFAGKRELAKHDVVLSIINSIPKEAEYVIWDTWTNSGKTCFNYVFANQAKFRDSWSSMGKIKSGELWQEASLYEAELLNRMQQKVKLVLIANHLKDYYLNNALTGKSVPASSRAFERICRARFWLRHNPFSPVPTALVLKRIDEKVLIDGKIRTVCILPRKVTPQEGDMSLWDTIERYYNEPFGNRKPLQHELPDEAELSILDGTLTDDQKSVWKAAILTMNEEREAQQFELLEAQKDTVKAYKDNGMTPAEIANKIGLKVPEVIKLLRD